MTHPRITELVANPPGKDRDAELIELCAHEPITLDGYALVIGKRTVSLSGTLNPPTCTLFTTGSLAIPNHEATVALLYKGVAIQTIQTAGTAPEGFGFHTVGDTGFWATSTPGIATGTPPALPPLPDLTPPSIVPGLLGTAACTAGILTVITVSVLRYVRDHHPFPRGNPERRR
jgi:hypothetical protein